MSTPSTPSLAGIFAELNHVREHLRKLERPARGSVRDGIRGAGDHVDILMKAVRSLMTQQRPRPPAAANTDPSAALREAGHALVEHLRSRDQGPEKHS